MRGGVDGPSGEGEGAMVDTDGPALHSRRLAHRLGTPGRMGPGDLPRGEGGEDRLMTPSVDVKMEQERRRNEFWHSRSGNLKTEGGRIGGPHPRPLQCLLSWTWNRQTPNTAPSPLPRSLRAAARRGSP